MTRSSLRLFDSGSRTVREIRPGKKKADGKGVVSFYCCGPTVYAPAHVGNFRTFIIEDVIRRMLERCGLIVEHARNITDQDDKTIQGAIAGQESLATFTRRWRTRFEEDSRALGLLAPHYEPSAVETIPLQIALIEKLIEKGNAYLASDGSVYFSVQSFGDYGSLSRVDCLSRDHAHGRLATITSSDEYSKEEIADFALWKAHKESDGQCYWESPWGRGRPGWHIECSAMALSIFGDSVDIHAGGEDLLFPHHENERAQSEAATGKPFVHHWVHCAHLLVDGKKMSKSLGNFYTLTDLTERGYSALDVRYALLNGHYRRALNLTFESLHSAQSALKRLQGFVAKTQVNVSDSVGEEPEWLSIPVLKAAWEALCDDLNIPEALGSIFTAIRTYDEKTYDKSQIDLLHYGVSVLLDVLGICPDHELHEAKSNIPTVVLNLANQRAEARKEKNWARSDALRDEIKSHGYLVEDGKNGSWKLLPL